MNRLFPLIGLTCIANLVLFMQESLAESLIATLSSRTVYITSNFTGAEVTVFGAIERDARTVSRAEPYMLAIKLVGPSATMVTRQKSPIFGIWVNKTSATYVNAPTFYSVNMTAPLDDLAIPAVLQREQIGLENLHLAEIETGSDPTIGNDSFRQAFLRLRQEHGYYQERDDAIELLNPSLFRTTFELPATVPVGEYEVTVYLFRGGTMLAMDSHELTIAKSGFEQFTYTFAHTNALLYGLVTVFLAIVTGWFASVIFRRD